MKRLPHDSIERVRAQWRAERPGLDTAPMAIIGRILRINQIASARMRRRFEPHGVDLSGFDVLATLGRAGQPYRLTPTALYKELMLSSGAMTNRLDVLERAGLIARLPDPQDRRGTLIELTAQGKTVLDAAMEAHMEGEAAMTGRLSARDQATLAALLHQLLWTLESDDGQT